MTGPDSPPEDPSTGADNSGHEEPVEGFYQAVSLDALFGSDEDDEDVVGGSAWEPRHDLPREAGAPPAGGGSPGSATSFLAAASEVPPNPHSLGDWVAVYFRAHADLVAPRTLDAKRLDLERFLNFVLDTLGHDHVDAWVPELTRAFLRELRVKPSPRTGRRLAMASIRRRLATLRHFALWVGERHQLAADPIQGVSIPRARRSPSATISRSDLRRVWRACLRRVEACHRQDQDPLLEAAVFQVLAGTDLRPQELVALDLDDYHSKNLHGTFRRGPKIRTKTWVPAEARRWLERYLREVRGASPGPLLLTRDRARFRPKGIHRICRRLADQANRELTRGERIHLTPNLLRRTTLERCPGKHAVYVTPPLPQSIPVGREPRSTEPALEEHSP